MLIAPISAIPSWEGFEYQRHIALYIALKHILEELESDNEDEIRLYKLGIEGEEDFSIIKGDNYISLHQVKEGAINLDDTDKACFILSVMQYNADYAYFHITPSASITLDFIEKTKKAIDTLLIELNKEVKTKEEFIEEIKELEISHGKKIKKSDALYEQTEAKYIVINKITSISPKGSLYKIVDFVCDGNKEKSNVIKVIGDVILELSEYENKLSGKCDSTIWDVYNERFDDSKSVIQNSCVIIEKILKKTKPEGCIFYDETYYQFVYGQLVLFSKDVITNSNTRSKKNSCKVEFSEMFNLITKNFKAESNTTEYHYYELLQTIKDVFEKYPTSKRTDCENDNCTTCTTVEECNLHRQINEICSKSYDDIKDFLYKLLLRTPKNNLPRDTVVNNLFIALLKRIKCLKYYDTNVILAEKNEKFYRLTLDENEYIEDFTEQLLSELNLQNADKFLIYESDVLITDRLNKPEFTYNQNNFNVMGKNELNEIKDITSDSIERQKTNYNKSKVMRIISKEMAEEELMNNE
ncbi:ABC-three component system protein [Desulfitobacterium sp. Sab5]|uniref:ABC-three component system protein n=1 Tax=Desulfitobacterium nosdiversum TaxID=3375356 RepID=UPI003CEF32B9